MATNSSLAILKAMETLPSLLAPAAQAQIRGFLQAQLLPEGAFANASARRISITPALGWPVPRRWK